MKKKILLILGIVAIAVLSTYLIIETIPDNSFSEINEQVSDTTIPDRTLLQNTPTEPPVYHLNKHIGNIAKVEINLGEQSVTVTKKEKDSTGLKSGATEIILNDDDSYSLYTLIATTYLVDYSGYDGKVAPNETLITMDKVEKTGIPTFKLPGYQNEVMGIFIGLYGASGGSSQKLHFVDIITGKTTSVSSGDQAEPIWHTDNGKLSYVKMNHIYAGPHVLIGVTGMEVVWETFRLDTTNFCFEPDKELFFDLCQNELNKIALSQKDIKTIKGKSFDEILNSEEYSKILRKLVGETYYLKKLNREEYIKQNILPYLDKSVIKELY
jgi:hypothetical protein